VLNGKTRMVSLAAALGVDFVTRRHLRSNLLVSCAALCLFWSLHGNDKVISLLAWLLEDRLNRRSTFFVNFVLAFP
jgi:hypothetical protein